MLKWFAEKISTHMLSILLVALTPALGAFAIYFRNELTTQVHQTSPQILVIILVSLALVCLALLAWGLYHFPSFKYLPKYQFYQHRVNGLYYCPPCRNKKPLSPLRYENSGWRCPFKECHAFYKDPDYKKPDPPPRPDLGPNAWMAR